MKKKILALALAALSLCLMLTGCMQTDIGIKMNKNETGSIAATLGIEEDFYEQLKESGSDPFDGKATVMTPASTKTTQNVSLILLESITCTH